MFTALVLLLLLLGAGAELGGGRAAEHLGRDLLDDGGAAHDPLAAGGAVAHLGPRLARLAHRVALDNNQCVKCGYQVPDLYLSTLPNVHWRLHLREADRTLQLIAVDNLNNI